MESFLHKFSLFHYNIGFFSFDADSLLHGNIKIEWMQHDYRDRFFADPFILSITDKEIKVLVEDFEYSRWKGAISLLVVDRQTYCLKRKKVLLDLDTHLSFPFIYREASDIFVIPENSASDKLTAWRYSESAEALEMAVELTDMPVIDPVLYKANGRFLLFGSLRNMDENRKLFQWESDNLISTYKLVSNDPIKVDIKSARRGGGFFKIGDQLYSATQCCEHTYGEALNICRVDALGMGLLEEKICSILCPDSIYPCGLHTLNVCEGLCVVDGLTFLFRPVEKLKAMFKRKFGLSC